MQRTPLTSGWMAGKAPPCGFGGFLSYFSYKDVCDNAEHCIQGCHGDTQGGGVNRFGVCVRFSLLWQNTWKTKMYFQGEKASLVHGFHPWSHCSGSVAGPHTMVGAREDPFTSQQLGNKDRRKGCVVTAPSRVCLPHNHLRVSHQARLLQTLPSSLSTAGRLTTKPLTHGPLETLRIKTTLRHIRMPFSGPGAWVRGGSLWYYSSHFCKALRNENGAGAQVSPESTCWFFSVKQTWETTTAVVPRWHS